MAQPDDSAPQSFVGGLKPLLDGPGREVTLAEVLERVEGHEGLGPVLLALVLPVLLPLPPPASMILALPLLIVSPQIAAARPKAWLPAWLARRSMRRDKLARGLKRVLPLLARIERKVRPRLSFLACGLGARLIGCLCMALSVVLILPLPFANLLPSLAIAAFGLGLTRKDGLMVLVGYALCAATVVLIVVGWRGVTLGAGYLRGHL